MALMFSSLPQRMDRGPEVWADNQERALVEVEQEFPGYSVLEYSRPSSRGKTIQPHPWKMSYS